MNTNMMKQFRLATAVFCMACIAGTSSLFAQDVQESRAQKSAPVVDNTPTTTITGKVVDAATKEAIPGVRVEGFGNNRTTAMTGVDGTFTIKVPENVTSLYVSTPGYSSVVIAAKQPYGERVIQLYSDKFSDFVKNEFDVTAKSTAQISTNTALSVESEIERQLGGNLRLINRSGTPGMGAMMMIQGVNTLNSSTQPLIILDGVVQDLQDAYASVHDGFFNNILAGIDVDDIEKVTVLKNGTAIYGAKGANGVILIDTRRGHSMATRIDAVAYGGYTMEPNLPTMMNSQQYRILANELMGGVETRQNRFPFLWDNPNYYYNMYHNDTKWSDYVYREAWSQNYKVNVQGGDEAAMYNFSLGYSDAESTIKCNDFNRLNIRFNTDVVLADNLKTRFDIAYSRINRNLRNDGIQPDFETAPVSAPGFLALIKSPFLNPYKYNNDGTLSPMLESADTYANFDVNTRNNTLGNPLSIFEYAEGNNKNVQEYTVFDVTFAPEWKLGKGFVLNGLFNYTLHRTNEKSFRPMTGMPNFYIDGLGYSQNEVRSFFSKESSVYADAHLDWSKRMGSHFVNAYAGVRFSNFAYDSSYQSCHNTGNDKLPDISASYDYLDQDGEDNVWRNMAWYANADYNYRNKYFVQGSLAAETSSRFGREITNGLRIAGVSWGIFPSLQAGWLMSAEPWFNINAINFLKLTAGFDISGNDNISNNAAFAYFSNVKYQNRAMGLSINNIENQSIQWESTTRYNFGIEAVTLNNRLKLGANLYHNVTNNLLTLKDLNYLTGLKQYWCNDGSLENNGFDVNLSAKVINTKNWKWELGASVAHYKNKVTALPDGDFETTVYGGSVLTAIGSPVGLFYGYKTDGVYATSADVPSQGGTLLHTKNATTGETVYFGAGDMKFVDKDGNNAIDENDRFVIGDPNPELFGNIQSSLSFKHITLDATFTYVYGNDIYNYQRSILESADRFYNQTMAVTNRWRTEGDVTNMPKATYGDPLGNNRFSDRWIEDGSFIRLKNLTLSYNVPVNLTWLQGLKVWCAANNVFTLTNYLGSDPEFSCSNNVLFQGIDTGLLGQSRSFHVGVKINL